MNRYSPDTLACVRIKPMRVRTAVSILLMATSLGIATPLQSQDPAVPLNPLDQLAWMVGGKWAADGDKGPDGKPFHVEWTCAWGENHRVLKFVTRFMIDGRLVPVYVGLYAWHPGKKKLVFVYTDNEGSLTEGEAVVTGDRVEQEFQIAEVSGTVNTFRSTIVHTGPDSYDWNVQHQKDGAWTVMFALKYKRQPA
jgi:hypothetical protein